MQQGSSSRWLLSPLALLTGVVPVFAVHLSLFVSFANDYIPHCNPYLEGCTSISAAGRYGLANHIFQAFMLPYASLLAFYWLACRRWLADLGDSRGPAMRWMPWLGLTSALFLVLYATFLGSEGDFYRLMRRYGVTVYFAFNLLAQVLLTKRLFSLMHEARLPFAAWIPRVKLSLCAIVLLLGLANVAGAAVMEDNRAFENVIEWNASLAMTLFYFLTWLAWRRTDYRV